MAPSFRLLLLLGAMSASLTKYVYVQERKTWSEARSHCTTTYTDLAPVNDRSDTNLLRELAGGYPGFIWFGLMRNETDPDKWTWSGGAEVKWFDWDYGEPNNHRYGSMKNYRWYDSPYGYVDFSFCYSAHVVREEKSWEEALEHCRKHHKDLASISSETEIMLMQKELDKGVSTAHVWTGLRFLSGDWLWLDRRAVEFEAWGSGGKPRCPEEAACGALVNGSVWEARDCEEKLHFICY